MPPPERTKKITSAVCDAVAVLCFLCRRQRDSGNDHDPKVSRADERVPALGDAGTITKIYFEKDDEVLSCAFSASSFCSSSSFPLCVPNTFKTLLHPNFGFEWTYVLLIILVGCSVTRITCLTTREPIDSIYRYSNFEQIASAVTG